MRGIKFEIVPDGPVLMKMAVVELEERRQFGLRNYFQLRHPNYTEVLTNEKSKDPVGDTELFLRVLDLPDDAILVRMRSPDENQQ